MAAIANVSLQDTFDTWRIRTNQLIVATDQLYQVQVLTTQNVSDTYNISMVYANTTANSLRAYANNIGNTSNLVARTYANTVGANVTNVMMAYTNTAANIANTQAVTFATANFMTIANGTQAWAKANTGGTFTGDVTVQGTFTSGAVFVNAQGLTARTGTGNYGVRVYPGGGTDATAAILQFTNAAQNAQWGSVVINTASMIVGSDASIPLWFKSAGTVRAGFDTTGTFVPVANNATDIGSFTQRWNNIYANDLWTGDLHLTNALGDWTIVEGEDDLFLYNNKKGKTYKFNLIEVDPSTAPAKRALD